MKIPTNKSIAKLRKEKGILALYHLHSMKIEKANKEIDKIIEDKVDRNEEVKIEELPKHKKNNILLSKSLAFVVENRDDKKVIEIFQGEEGKLNATIELTESEYNLYFVSELPDTTITYELKFFKENNIDSIIITNSYHPGILLNLPKDYPIYEDNNFIKADKVELQTFKADFEFTSYGKTYYYVFSDTNDYVIPNSSQIEKTLTEDVIILGLGKNIIEDLTQFQVEKRLGKKSVSAFMDGIEIGILLELQDSAANIYSLFEQITKGEFIDKKIEEIIMLYKLIRKLPLNIIEGLKIKGETVFKYEMRFIKRGEITLIKTMDSYEIIKGYAQIASRLIMMFQIPGKYLVVMYFFKHIFENLLNSYEESRKDAILLKYKLKSYLRNVSKKDRYQSTLLLKKLEPFLDPFGRSIEKLEQYVYTTYFRNGKLYFNSKSQINAMFFFDLIKNIKDASFRYSHTCWKKPEEITKEDILTKLELEESERQLYTKYLLTNDPDVVIVRDFYFKITKKSNISKKLSSETIVGTIHIVD